jgi:uncharacterized membrane protein YfcA
VSALLTFTFLTQIAITLVAGLVRGFSGFGAALIMAPAFTLVMAPREAVGLTILLNCATILQLLPAALRLTRWSEIGPMGLAAMAAIPFGNLLLIAIDGPLIRRAIGAVVLGFSVAMLAGWRYTRPPTRTGAVVVGALSGLLTGSAGMGGPPVILYMLTDKRAMRESRAGFITFFALSQLVATPLLFWTGVVTGALLIQTALLAPAYFVAIHLGAKLFPLVDEALVRRLALGFLLVIGVATLVR